MSLWRLPALEHGLLTAGSGSVLGSVSSYNPWGSMLSLLGTIAVLVFVLYLAYKGTRLLGRRYGAAGTTEGGMEILARTALAPESSLVIVKLKDRVLLLGVTPHHIERLAELDPLFYEHMAPQTGTPDAFAVLLKDTIGSFDGYFKGKKDKADE